MRLKRVGRSILLVHLIIIGQILFYTTVHAQEYSEEYFEAERRKAELQINNHPDSARAHMANMLKYAYSTKLPFAKAQSYHYLVIWHFYANNLDSVQIYSDSAETHYKQVESPSALRDFMKLKANVYLAVRQSSKAVDAYRKGERLEPQENIEERTEYIRAIAGIYSDLEKYDSAYYYFRRAQELASQHNNPQLLSKQYSSTATLQFKQALYHRSLENYLKAKKVYPNSDNRTKYLLSINIAKVYNAIGQFANAMNELQLHEKAILNFMDKGFSSAFYEEKGVALTGMEKFKEANTHLDSAANSHLRLQDTNMYVQVKTVFLENLLVLGKMEQVENSINHLSTSLSGFLGKNITARGHLWGVKSKLHLQLHRQGKLSKSSLAKTADQLQITIAELEEIKRYRELPEFYELLITMRRRLQQPVEALELYDGLTQLKDTLFGLESTRKLTQLELQYEFDKKVVADSLQNARIQAEKDAEIKVERARVKQRTTVSYAAAGSSLLLLLLVGSVVRSRNKTRLQKKDIEKRNTQIEWLLKEIHHRVKNNMQIVSSLMSIQSRTLPDEASKSVIRESQNRIKSMSLVHESLYLFEVLSLVEIGPFISNIAKSVQQSLQGKEQNIHLIIEAESLQLNAEQAVPLGIIVNELTSNAYKHAFKDATEGQLRITFKKEDDRFQLQVDDNGPALPKDFKVDFRGASIGMALVKSLAEEQLEGDFMVDSSGASKFTIRFT